MKCYLMHDGQNEKGKRDKQIMYKASDSWEAGVYLEKAARTTCMDHSKHDLNGIGMHARK